MFEEKFKVIIKGIAPLLMNRFIVEEKSGKTKTSYVPEEEAKKSLYLTSDEKLFQPAIHFESSFVKRAKALA